MEANKEIINTFATRVRQLILQNRELRKENSSLHAQADDMNELISQLRIKVERLKNDYDTLKLSKTLELTDGDLEASKARIAKLIREVNKCITILSGENDS